MQAKLFLIPSVTYLPARADSPPLFFPACGKQKANETGQSDRRRQSRHGPPSNVVQGSTSQHPDNPDPAPCRVRETERARDVAVLLEKNCPTLQPQSKKLDPLAFDTCYDLFLA